MINDSSTLPVPIVAGGNRVSTVAQLALIPEEDIWLAKQKSARTRRAYRLDVAHFMRTQENIPRAARPATAFLTNSIRPPPRTPSPS